VNFAERFSIFYKEEDSRENSKEEYRSILQEIFHNKSLE